MADKTFTNEDIDKSPLIYDNKGSRIKTEEGLSGSLENKEYIKKGEDLVVTRIVESKLSNDKLKFEDLRASDKFGEHEENDKVLYWRTPRTNQPQPTKRFYNLPPNQRPYYPQGNPRVYNPKPNPRFPTPKKVYPFIRASDPCPTYDQLPPDNIPPTPGRCFHPNFYPKDVKQIVLLLDEEYQYPKKSANLATATSDVKENDQSTDKHNIGGFNNDSKVPNIRGFNNDSKVPDIGGFKNDSKVPDIEKLNNDSGFPGIETFNNSVFEDVGVFLKYPKINNAKNSTADLISIASISMLFFILIGGAIYYFTKCLKNKPRASNRKKLKKENSYVDYKEDFELDSFSSAE